MIVLVCLNPILTDFGFSRFRCTRADPRKVLKYFPNFCQILGKSGNSKEISSLLHRSKEGSGYGSKGGVHESKKIKIGQNVFKQPKTIIESRLSTAPVRTAALPSVSAPPPGVPRWAPVGGAGRLARGGGHSAPTNVQSGPIYSQKVEAILMPKTEDKKLKTKA